jgi:beta-1,4-mannosyl-glycoprotein beta-1,4-N-acetylglucosaminyltransferase
MKIYDCFMFSDEKMLLDIRLNTLNKFVDKFIITEATYLHNGESKKLNFNINDFSKFKNKIEYIVVENQPSSIILEDENDNLIKRDEKKIFNSIQRDNYQREQLISGLKKLDEDDIIIISDLDEIPNLNNFNLKEINNEIIVFKQKMFYYKLNLVYENFIWFGSKALKKKNFISPQWLRNIKNKTYPFWRLDTLFSKKKYNNIKFIENGGWHFTCIKEPIDIHKKLLTFAHHQDYERSNISLFDLEKKVKEKRVLYDHKTDKKNESKWFSDEILKKIELKYLPNIILQNKTKFQNWLD